MKKVKTFPFEKARRITGSELKANRLGIQKKINQPRPVRGRPLKKIYEKYQAVAIRLHPEVLKWAKARAKKQGIGYQTIINQALLALAA